MMVGVGVTGVVFGQAHGGAEYIDRECDHQQGSVLLKELRSAVFVGEKYTECGSESESDKVGETVELRTEFGTGIHKASGKTIQLVQKHAEHYKVGAHAEAICSGKGIKGSSDPADGENAQ